jgi:hypothetical protein
MSDAPFKLRRKPARDFTESSQFFYLSYDDPIDTIPPPLYVPFIVSTKSISFICSSCNKTFDDSLVRLVKKPRAVTSIGDPRTQNQDVMFECLPEDRQKKLEERVYEYAEINKRFEPQDEEMARNQGWTILDSKIQLTDSQGRNKTLVRRI